VSASISLEIHLAPGHCGHKRIRKGKKPSHAKTTRLPRITRLMALAIKYEHLIADEIVDGQDALATLAGVDRSQISRILRLRLLAPDIQEAILNLPEVEEGRDIFNWTKIDVLTRIECWRKQTHRFKSLRLPRTSSITGTLNAE
tara:strand:+ start:25721 stop:26152 length:432 start_codon:yes stop_codon:yes gene_type:complete